MPDKTSKNDFVPTFLIKNCSVIFSELITKLANLSFTQGKFPTMFKLAIVTPLLKKPNLDSALPANYRPIANLNNISKILERLFLNRIRPHVTHSQNFNPLQSAYRPNHSTETALLATLDSVYHAADKSKATILVALDQSAAFDMIDHDLFLSRLKTSFGIDGLALQWVKSYITERTQRVTIGTSTSDISPCTMGVPQGSVLGPMFFTLFISPIAQIFSRYNISHQQFADDTQLYISVSPGECIVNIEQCTKTLESWFCQNGLCLNPNKSESILLGTAQRLKNMPSISHIQVADSDITLSASLKTLGVTIDSTLTFNKHVNAICKSCNFHIRALKHIRSSLDEQSAKSVACSIVQSRLDYANSILFGISRQNIDKLQRIQNSLSRIVLGPASALMKHAQRLNTLHWLPIDFRIKFKIASLTHKILKSREPAYLFSLLHPYTPSRNLRSSSENLLSTPRIATKIGSRAFRYSAPVIWNSLPNELRSSQVSEHTFRSHLKTYLFKSAFPN
jgi:hypothetical protein